MEQFGFCRKRSTARALLQCTDDIVGNMENGQMTGAVKFDQEKAFDTVNHRVFSIRALGAEDSSIRWFKQYVNNRNQKTVMRKAIPSSRTENIGVPQGSIFGPLFFLVFILDD